MAHTVWVTSFDTIWNPRSPLLSKTGKVQNKSIGPGLHAGAGYPFPPSFQPAPAHPTMLGPAQPAVLARVGKGKVRPKTGAALTFFAARFYGTKFWNLR